MPIKHIAVLTSNMDSSKPDSTDMDGTNARDTATVGETTEHVEGSLEVGDIDQATPGSTCTHEDKEMAQLEGCKAGDKECDSEEDRETAIELACDIDKALCDGGDTVETVVCGTDNAACNAHIVVDTVIVGDSASVGYHKQGSPKEDRQGSQVHINVQTITAARNEFNNSPVNGGTDSKRRSSGKSSKKDKPSPFKKKDSLPTKEILNPNSPTPLSTDRCDSSLSTNSGDLCRICQCDKCEIQYDSPLVSPCLCSGSLKYIHQACLQKWIKSSDKLSCELCMFEYSMTKKTKPFSEWERLDMTPAERRKVICSVTFHVIAITCVVWSLYVLIDRTTEEVEAGTLLWPFWTKLIVVAIGFTGGVVFMYVQCKMYLTLCKKWRMYNKVIIISSISEGQREKANQQGIIRMNAKQAQLEAERPDLNVFNIVNETESV